MLQLSLLQENFSASVLIENTRFLGGFFKTDDAVSWKVECPMGHTIWMKIFLPPRIHRALSSSLIAATAKGQATGVGCADLWMLSIEFFRKRLLCKLVKFASKHKLSPPHPNHSLLPRLPLVSISIISSLRPLSASIKISNYFSFKQDVAS